MRHAKRLIANVINYITIAYVRLIVLAAQHITGIIFLYNITLCSGHSSHA